MATLYVTEFAQTVAMNGTQVGQMRAFPPVVEQTVAITGASVQSNAFNALTQCVRLMADSVCSVEVGASPTASATTMRLAANVPEYFAVVPGQKIAVITNT